MTVTQSGKICRGTIVLSEPLDLPDGTSVVVQVKTAVKIRVSKTSTKPSRKARPLTSTQLRNLAKKSPPPPEWWNASDNPFEA